MFIVTVGGLFGLIVGGALIQSFDWHWIFFVNVLIGFFMLWVGSLMINEIKVIGFKHGIDVFGSLLVMGLLMLLVYVIVTLIDHGWGFAHMFGFGGVGVALLVAFGWWEVRVKNLIFLFWILCVRSLIGVSMVCGLIVVGWFGLFFLGVFYFEYVLGFDALQIGLVFLLMMMLVLIMLFGLSVWIMVCIGLLLMVVSGMLLTVFGLIGFVLVDVDANYFLLILILFVVLGVSGGFLMLLLLMIVMFDVFERDVGFVFGIVNVLMQVVVALGIVIFGMFVIDYTCTFVVDGVSCVIALIDGYYFVFIVGAGFVVFAAFVALLVVWLLRLREEVMVVEFVEVVCV